jgi:hypothetical protein
MFLPARGLYDLLQSGPALALEQSDDLRLVGALPRFAAVFLPLSVLAFGAGFALFAALGLPPFLVSVAGCASASGFASSTARGSTNVGAARS